MKNENLILTLAAIAACLLFWLLLSGCHTGNLILNDQAEAEWIKEPMVNKLGGWNETVPNNVIGTRQEFKYGYATGDMQKDSTYRMLTTGGWIMSVKYDQIAWVP